MSGQIRYELLLDLYRGKATAVEQISADDRNRLAVETPITTFLGEADTSGARHVLLTGNAGDGKTFAIVSSSISQLEVIRDASESLGDSEDPLLDLAAHTEQALTDGKRLLVAINRGQLERLTGFLRSTADYPQSLRLFATARPLLRLQVQPVESATDVAVIDLGLFDTLSDAVLDPILDKVSEAEITGLADGPTATAVRAAQSAFKNELIRRAIKVTLRHSRLTEQHATMRQIWSVISFLITGGRAANDSSPVTLGDSVGVRLFAETSKAPLLGAYRNQADPSLVPQARLDRAILNESWREQFEDLPGLQGLAVLSRDDARGRTAARAGLVHGATIVEKREVPDDPYEQAVLRLRQRTPEWHKIESITDRLLAGAYSALGLWHADGTYPAWGRLCFDATRAPSCGVAAFACIERRRLGIALPRPNTVMLQTLGTAWWPPYLLLGLEADGVWHTLRLTPRLFRLLFAESYDERRAMTSAEVLLIERWLSGAPTDQPNSDRVWVGLSRHDALRIEKHPLSREYTVSLQWQGGRR